MSKEKEKVIRATHQGELDINGFKISCAVLENGERILVNRSLANAFGIKGSGAYWQKKKKQKGAALPEYLSAKYLQPFISDTSKLKLYNTISYKNKAGIETEGVDATFLSDICDIYIRAGESGAFKNSPEIPKNAYGLLLALSKVAITALVDEVTGYQYLREKDELQKILKSYIAEELLPWQKKFPDEFYKEIFRLRGWDYTVSGIKQRPGVIGTWTKNLIYKQLPKGVLKELYSIIPKTSTGKLAKRLHQGLTVDVGNPHLEKQLISVITLMNVSDSWGQFEKMFNKKFGQQKLDFESEELIEPKTSKTEFDKNLKGLLNTPPPHKDNSEK